MEKQYNPQIVEDKLYKTWEEKGYFEAKVNADKVPFSIVIPPPNVTGQLHMGHALDETLQDIIIRFKRMQGFETLWMPGTDHAGIATQIKVEAQLREKGLTRHDLGRDKFIEKVWEWKHEYGSRIINQLKKLGSSCDWSKERFTMDEGCSNAVKEVFVNLYEKNLIYRGNRIINWCPSCATALSNAEVEYADKDGNLWHIKYKIKDSDEYLTVATTRPETMLGDTGVAVNPEDKRYTHLIGKTAILPLMDREIPIVADEYVSMEFGTGCVKMTPAHDPNDFEIAMRHNLEFLNVLNEDATINENGGKYRGLERYEARKQVVKDLENIGLLVEIKKHKHNVGQCYRCSTTVEPRLSDQWFVKMEPLAKPALEVVLDGNIRFVPDRFTKVYQNWMENINDWCISRQLWWGHRIPAYYCNECDHMVVSKDDVHICEKCKGEMYQDEDVLDTWFSSALWPFSTLGWPEKTELLDYFYPTNVLVTGYDIIFFWVARMIFSGLEHMNQKPFSDVFIHGLVRDSQGRKMSKSLGNGIDPLEIISEYGADALRFTLATGNSPGNDMRFYIERVESSRNFANKIWNASRFIEMNLTINELKLPDSNDLRLVDKWILSKYNSLVKEVTDNLENYELGVAVSKLYDFIWEEYCDWYIEFVKPRLYGDDNKDKEVVQRVLSYVLSNSLKLLHPFMPFITEEIYLTLPHDSESIMISNWPEYKNKLNDIDAEKKVYAIKDSIRHIRNRRQEMNVPPSKKTKLYILTEDVSLFDSGEIYIKKLAFADDIEIGKDFNIDLSQCVTVVCENAQIFIPLNQLVDINEEIERLEKEKIHLQKEIKMVNGKLGNKNFIDKAPKDIVDNEKEKLQKYTSMLDGVIERIESLSK